MARKKDNKEAMFEALSRGTGSSMRLPDWAKPSSPQPFEHPEMLEKPEKRKEEPKAEPTAAPEITIKLKAAASGFARKFKSFKDNLDERRKASVERKLAAIEEARKSRESRQAEKLLAEEIEAAAAEEAAKTEAAEEQVEVKTAPAAEQAEKNVPAETKTPDRIVREEVTFVEEVEIIEAEIVEDDELPQSAQIQTDTDDVEDDSDEEYYDETDEIEEEIAAEDVEETPTADNENADLFTSTDEDIESEEERPNEEQEDVEDVASALDEQAEDTATETEVEEKASQDADDKSKKPGEEAGGKVDDKRIKSVTPEAEQEKPQSMEVTPSVTAVSIQQQVDLVEDNALLAQTLYARQVAMETSPEDSVHISLSRKAFFLILCAAVGIFCVVFLLGSMIGKKHSVMPATAQEQPSQTSEQAQLPAPQENKPEPEPQPRPKPVEKPKPAQAATATPAATVRETPVAESGEPTLTAEPGKRDPKRYYLVIQQLVSTSEKDREEAFNIAEFCKEHGLPAEVVMIDGKKLAVWSLVGLKVTDDDNARKHALMVEQLGKDYFKASKTYDFRQRMRDGRLRPYYMKGKPYAPQNTGNND